MENKPGAPRRHSCPIFQRADSPVQNCMHERTDTFMAAVKTVQELSPASCVPSQTSLHSSNQLGTRLKLAVFSSPDDQVRKSAPAVLEVSGESPTNAAQKRPSKATHQALKKPSSVYLPNHVFSLMRSLPPSVHPQPTVPQRVQPSTPLQKNCSNISQRRDYMAISQDPEGSHSLTSGLREASPRQNSDYAL